MIDEDAIRQRWEAVGSQLDERGRRLFAAGEVRTAGWGGLAVVSKITGLARSTINRGEDDIDAKPLPKGRVRRAGGGRRAVCENDPGLVPALERLVAPATLGDPMRHSGHRHSPRLARICGHSGPGKSLSLFFEEAENPPSFPGGLRLVIGARQATLTTGSP